MKQSFIILFALVTLFSSCKKDSTPTCDLNLTNISGTYKITSLIYKADATTPETDVFLLYDACQKDDLFSFNANGTYVISEGATSCSPSNSDSGNWSLGGTTIIIDGEAAEVLDFSCNGFKARTTDVTSGEVITVTFAKQ
jgi:hypothetical protein